MNKLRPVLKAMLEMKKAFVFAENYAKVAKNAGEVKKAANLLFAESGIKGLVKATQKGADDVEMAKVLLGSLGVDGTKPGFETLDVSAGLELSVLWGVRANKFAIRVS